MSDLVDDSPGVKAPNGLHRPYDETIQPLQTGREESPFLIVHWSHIGNEGAIIPLAFPEDPIQLRRIPGHEESADLEIRAAQRETLSG
jgi:hypothetical protein